MKLDFNKWFLFYAVIFCLLAIQIAGCKTASPPSQPNILSGALPAATKIPDTWIAETDTTRILNNWLALLNDTSLKKL
jgi:hypothetical protein